MLLITSFPNCPIEFCPAPQTVPSFFTKNNTAIKSVQFLSVDGKLLKTVNDYNSGEGISIYNLAKGTYILKAVYKNGETEYGRVIKM